VTVVPAPSSSSPAAERPAAPDEGRLAFGAFRLDRANARLLRGDEPVALTPKALDVLHHLASRPDRLVTKHELLSAVWADVLVSDASIKVCVREIRKALDDDADDPRYIQTVHRRGYRFIAKVEREGVPGEGSSAIAAPATALCPAPPLIGRKAELHTLREAMARARAGARQCVFVTGSPGSGKTALVESFIRSVEEGTTRVIVGHCFEQFGAGEPYMPIWEALGRISSADAPREVASLVERHAIAHEASAATTTTEPRAMPERLLREMIDGIDALAADAPLVLGLEDVQWADFSTLDLISALARRRHSPARLLVLATYRSEEVATPEHPLRALLQRLVPAGLCTQLPLSFLDEPAVAGYVAKRCPGAALPPSFAKRLHQRTEGHPLFLVHLLDDLIEQRVLFEDPAKGWVLSGNDAGVDDDRGAAWVAVLETQVPGTVRAMIDLQVDRLSPAERRVLEAAAVAGVEFSAAAVAGALSEDGVAGDVVPAESVCETLAQRYRFLQPRGVAEWPDGTAATHYRFVHELYHNVVYERIPAARRAQMHRALGLRMESAWSTRAGEEAATLAMHFEAGRDWPRAVRYLRQAADAAARQYAHREAARYLRRASDAVARLAAADRAEHELPLLMALGMNLQITDGFAAPEVKEIYARARALCLAGDVASFPVLWGVWLFHKVRSDLRPAEEMAGQLLDLARASNDPVLLLQAHQALCVTNFCLGKFELTRLHMDEVAAIYDPVAHAHYTPVYGQDPSVATLAIGSVASWLLGRAADATRASEASLRLARRLGQPSTLSLATHFAAVLHQLRGDVAKVRELSESAIARATDEGFSFWLAGGVILRGWAAAAQGELASGISEIRRGIDGWGATGSRTYLTYFLGLLADALMRAYEPAEAIKVIDEALDAAEKMPEGIYDAELHRLKGCALRLAPGACRNVVADQCFARARDVARQQGAAWLLARAEPK
jgi:DNA-binding winged helix-turn-helix (wHTH) protein/predicted ATPase